MIKDVVFLASVLQVITSPYFSIISIFLLIYWFVLHCWKTFRPYATLFVLERCDCTCHVLSHPLLWSEISLVLVAFTNCLYENHIYRFLLSFFRPHLILIWFFIQNQENLFTKFSLYSLTSLYICVCTYICMYGCICMYVCAYVYMYVYVYIRQCEGWKV